MIIRLDSTQPYSLSLSLKRLEDMPRQVLARVEPGPVFVRPLVQGDRVGLIRVAADGDALGITAEGELDSARVAAQVRHAFSLDLDLAGFLRHLDEADPVLARLVRHYEGARPILAFDLWESLAWAIIGQQINVAFAYTLKEGLIRRCGRSYQGYPIFPDPAAVARLDYADLRAEKYTQRKAEYLIDLARSIVNGRLNLEQVVAQPFEIAVHELVKLRGVGRWTAECLLMDAGALDAFPADDIGIRNAVQRGYGLDHQPTEAEVRSIGEPWAPYRALACYYLWLALLDKSGTAFLSAGTHKAP